MFYNAFRCYVYVYIVFFTVSFTFIFCMYKYCIYSHHNRSFLSPSQTVKVSDTLNQVLRYYLLWTKSVQKSFIWPQQKEKLKYKGICPMKIPLVRFIDEFLLIWYENVSFSWAGGVLYNFQSTLKRKRKIQNKTAPYLLGGTLQVKCEKSSKIY